VERQLVKSSNIKSVGYDAETRTLEVEFLSGGIYQHTDISPEQHRALIESESPGKFYNATFRNLKCAKVR
jgi:hypothetical protein